MNWFRTLRTTGGIAVLATALGTTTASAAVEVTRGATALENGDATAAEDIQLRNDELVASIAVGSAPPWGVAPGGIIDAAPIVDGEPLRDKVSLIDFIPNNWSSWPTSYQRFEVLEDGPDEAAIRVTRDWEDVTLTTTYRLESGSDRIHVVTEMDNTGDKAYEGILSGYVMWPDGGNLFGPAGMHETEEGETTNAFADWSAAYDENWGFVLHAPYMDRIDYSARDLYLKHDLAPGESRSFEGWVQVLDDGSLAPAVDAEVARKGLEAGTVSGEVATEAGATVERPVVVVEKNGEPYTWALGRNGEYQLNLPKGDYDLYATARGYADSDHHSVSIGSDPAEVDFSDLKAPGQVAFTITDDATGEPLDAKILIAEGQTPLVGFLGRKTFFSELDEPGKRTVSIAPGEYVFEVAHGTPFLANSEKVSVTVPSGETVTESVPVKRTTTPNNRDWFAADMHHHSDVLDGFTGPEYVVRSQLAAGLDLTLLSDHDTMANLEEMAALSEQRNVPFIPSIEISPSWGHFNAYPVEIGTDYAIDSGKAPVQSIIDQRDALGAEAIQVNHPYIKYGYYTNVENETTTGGYYPRYDLLEVNADGEYEKTLRKAWNHWSRGERIYLSAGSDVHDVWQYASGEVRAYAHVPGTLDADTFVTALKGGHAFVTFGPMVYPDHTFGDDLKVAKGETATLGFDLEAANGLKAIRLVSDGGNVVEKKAFNGAIKGRAEFEVTAKEDTFYAVIVEDQEGKKAYSNPIWLDAMTHVPAPEAADADG